MEKILVKLTDWSLAVCENYKCKHIADSIKTISDVKNAGFDIIPAKVPGNFELDMMRAGLIDYDPFWSTNNIKIQELENRHCFYYVTFDKPKVDAKLCFDGIDTIADIYINGVLTKSVENMYLEYEIPLVTDTLREKDNEILVHIKPVMIEERKYETSLLSRCTSYNIPSINIRKAPHMWGWDIMPRIVSAGIWKDSYIKERKSNRVKEFYIYTDYTDVQSRTARISCFASFEISEDYAQDYSFEIKGVCKDSSFRYARELWGSSCHPATNDNIENCYFWWPKNAGEQDMYDVTVTLMYKGEVVDVYTTKFGIRTVELDRTDTTDENGSGEFRFIINGTPIFCMGSNWVPLDAFHSRDKDRLEQAFMLMVDTGCNIVRCWGGNTYESREFYDLCDKYGIMVWQDFAMGCAIYPQDDRFCKLLEEEVIQIVKRFRQHPSLILWAGDNECDYLYMNWGPASVIKRDPDNNILTRKVIPKLVEIHDYTRPYLPSSPYMSNEAAKKGTSATPSEDHLWGPRDYFKGDFYKNSICHFASETGYHACPSPVSVKKFIPEDELWPWYDKNGKEQTSWLAHAVGLEYDRNWVEWAYRIRLMASQVDTLFEDTPDCLDTYARMSQISQAEAKKYFIERFRLSKWRRTGIIWWNIVDGWPQFSDAVVDYFFTKKLAYHYIKRSQEPLCMMFDEPKDGKIDLYAVNDYLLDKEISYKVTNITDGKEVLSGTVHSPANTSVKAGELEIVDGEKKFYLIEFIVDGKVLKNHYFTNIIKIDYQAYMSAIDKCGFNQFEGF